jgi:hypothetical protein
MGGTGGIGGGTFQSERLLCALACFTPASNVAMANIDVMIIFFIM